MVRGAWRTTVHGVAKNWTQLNDSLTHTHTHSDLEVTNHRWEEKGTTEDEMVGWHHRLNGHEFE